VIFLGIVLGVTIAMFTAKKYNIEKMDIALSTILACIGMIVGAKIVYIITVIPEVIDSFSYVKTHIPETLMYLFGGYVFYGGLIGALFGYWFYCKYFQIDFNKVINIISPVIPLVHSFGRIGCFLGGCCYGIEYHGRFAINFPKNEFVENLDAVPRFPVQLLESGINFILFIALMFYGRKPRKSGSILGIYLICYAIIRFSLEFLRGDVERGIFFGVSTSQWISLILVPIGIYLVIRKEKE
jgi:phosphatidylglycerol:prolipoprotein diacylglycerol transferase